MRKKKQSVLLSAALALTLAATGAGAIGTPGARSDAALQNGTQYSTTPTADRAGIAESYEYGTEFTVPAFTFDIGGNRITATAVLQFPDGSATRQTKVILNMSGIYTLRYTAIADGTPYTQEYTFTVAEPLFAVSGEKSSFTYGKWDAKAAGATLEVSESGLLVRLAEGESFNTNQLIKVGDLTKAQSLVKTFVTPSSIGTADFGYLMFTFTDAVDPSMYMRVKAQYTDGDDVTWYQAGATDQPLTGYEAWCDKVHVNDNWGIDGRHTFGKFGGDEYALDSRPIELNYDSGENAVYVNCTQTGQKLIIDFDSPKFFSELWRGFPSGYARLSITAGDYKNAFADFCITEIFGVDLRKETYETETPIITAETDGIYTEMPKAVKGGSYPVPNATAFDNYCGNTAVKTSVYYNYGASNAVSVPIENGRFVTAREGTYAIAYDAVNSRGKRAQKILWVECVSELPAITITGDIIGTTQQATCGIETKVSFDGLTLAGGSGNKTVRVYTEFNGAIEEINGGFRPDEVGDYTVKFVATDYIGQTCTACYTVSATASDTPVFVDEPILPAYFIEGGEYTVPEVYANDYSSGKLSRVVATVTIDDRSYSAGDTFIPTAKVNKEVVHVTFACKGATYGKDVTVIKPYITEGDGEDASDNLHMENYFVGSGIVCEPNVNSITVKASEQDGGFTFANALLAENFTMRLRGIQDSAKFGGLYISFADSEDANKSVTAKIENTGSSATVRLGGEKVSLDYGFVNGGTFTLGMRKSAFTVDTTSINVKTYDSGKSFEGFPSGKLMLSVSFYDAEANARFNVLSINGQSMTNMTIDRNGPKIAVLGEYGGTVGYGEIRTLPVAAASDVLTPFVKSFTLTVTDPEGNVATDMTGKQLRNVDPSVAYTVKFDKYGQYNVRYAATDKNRGSTTNFFYTFMVVDEIAPVITLTSKTVTAAKIGDAIALPDFTVSDNVTATENIKILKYVMNPHGELITLPDASNSIRCATAGEYEFRLIAVDEAGNMHTMRFTVTVTEA